MASSAGFWSELNRLFSVVCQLDSRGHALRSSSLLKQHTGLRDDTQQSFFDLFEFKRPSGFDGSFEHALKHQGQLFLGYSTQHGFAIRGQLLDFTEQGLEGLCFVGVPWLWWMQSHSPSTSLTLADFPVHDVQMDQLFFMTTQQTMVDDLQTLNAELSKAKHDVEQATLARQRYFTHLSHEMRSPLNGVISALSLLSEGLVVKEHRDFLLLAQQSAHRLLEVVNYTLDVATGEAEEMQDLSEAFSLDVLLNDAVASVRASALTKGIGVQRCGQQRFSQDYEGHPKLLRQVLSNLLSNAVKFSSGGTVTVEAHIEEQLSDERDLLYFAVIDEGPGIPQAVLTKIFEPFTTGLSEATAGEQGTGLGLSIVNRFVDAMGGSIEVESEEGRGSIFSFNLSLSRVGHASDDMDEAHRQTVSRLSGHVLVVDDVQSNLMLHGNLLQSMGLDITTAQSGEEALLLIENHPPNTFSMVLLDVEMPGVDGYEACRRIRAIEHAKHLPIIALTGSVGVRGRRRIDAAGMNGFVAKPVVRKELLTALAKWLPAALAESGSHVTVVETERPQLADDATHFDAQKVQTLINDVGIESTRRLVDAFLNESASRWDALQRSMNEHSWDAVGREAHTLASSCGTFGIVLAAKLFRRIEERAYSSSPARLDDLDVIAVPLGEGIAALERLLGEYSDD